MPFQKGNSGNPAGKPKGTKNKAGSDLREKIILFLEDNFDQVQKDFNELSPVERARVFKDLLQFALPKLKTMDLVINESQLLPPVIMRYDDKVKSEV